MPSIQAHVMNLVFRCMPRDKPGQLHDYEAERKRNDRKPPRPGGSNRDAYGGDLRLPGPVLKSGGLYQEILR